MKKYIYVFAVIFTLFFSVSNLSWAQSMTDASSKVITFEEQNLHDILIPPAQGSNYWSIDNQKFLQQFYQIYADDYDFIALFPTKNLTSHYSQVVNRDIEGIGAWKSNSNYAKKLKTIAVVTDYPKWQANPSFDDRYIRQLLIHEIAHHWLYYIKLTANGDSSHYPSNQDLFSGDPRYIDPMSYYLWIVKRSKENCVDINDTNSTVKFSNLSLYLMGLLPSDQVPTIPTYKFKEKPGDPHFNMYGPECGDAHQFTRTKSISINSIIKTNGARNPAYKEAQKDFKIAFVILTDKGSTVPSGFVDYVNKNADALPDAWNQMTNGISHMSIVIPSPKSPISVIAPNGGENWVRGTNVTAYWQDSKVSRYNVYLIGNNNQQYTLGEGVYSSSSNFQGSYGWTVGTTSEGKVPDGKYTLKVCEISAILNCDSSDAPFNITSGTTSSNMSVIMGTPSITTALDTSGFINKVTYSIPVTITAIGQTLYLGQTVDKSTKISGTNAFAYVFQDSTAPTTDLTNGSSVANISSSDASIENMGYRLDAGATKHFTINVILTTPAISGHYYRVALKQLQTFTNSSLSTRGVVETLIPAENYQTVFQNIGSTKTSTISVLSPNGGEGWVKGTTQTISWNDTHDISTHEIKLSPYVPPCTSRICPMIATREPYTIANLTGSSFNWVVGKTWEDASVPTGTYTIEICQTGTSNCDTSDGPFKVTEGTITPTTTTPTKLNPNTTQVDSEVSLLKKGSTGEKVSKLQAFLNAAGYLLGKIDGKFGVQTEAAVIKYQKETNQPASGQMQYPFSF